jgi:hypothetical protein
MFIYQLRLAIAPQQDAEIVKPGNDTLQFDTVDQEDRHGNFGFPRVVQECVLKVLSVGSHLKTFVLAMTADRFNVPVMSLCFGDAEDSSPKISPLPS